MDKNHILETILREKKDGIKGRLYHKIQIEFTYNSNHIAGNMLTNEETRYIYELNRIGLDRKSVNTDDIVETSNHFCCINMVLENVNEELNETFIKDLHRMLKHGTSDSRKNKIGEYKKSEEVKIKMQELLKEYNKTKVKTLDEILDFHYKIERIHPFQDGNGRVGRLILFKECLRNNIVPFISDEYLVGQEKFKSYLEYFEIPY